MEGGKLICGRCRVELREEQASFSYLGNTFSAPMPKCPECGQVFVSEQVAKGRMAEVEAMLESK